MIEGFTAQVSNASVTLLATTTDPFMPVGAGRGSDTVDMAFWVIFWICVVFFVIIMGAMTIFLLKYRRTPERQHAEPAPHHHTALELFWSILPLLIVIVIFWVGWKGFDESQYPDDRETAEVIDVIGYKWDWKFVYRVKDTEDPSGESNVVLGNQLHLVKNKLYKLRITSTDVIHSVFIPAFRVKRDAVPGRYSSLYIRPEMTGVFPLRCTEYCGTKHSMMLADVVVHENDRGVKEVLANAKKLGTGEGIYTLNCKSCHSVDGTRKIGPPLNVTGIDLVNGADRDLENGSKVKVDEQYIHDSIRNPQKHRVAKYEGQNMTPFGQEQLSEEEIGLLIDYMRSFGPKKTE